MHLRGASVLALESQPEHQTGGACHATSSQRFCSSGAHRLRIRESCRGLISGSDRPARATSAEGIATGAGSTFYAGDLFAGDIFRGDLRAGTASLFIDAPAGRQALGMKADIPHGLLFVAGGFTGQAYVYDLRTGADVAMFQLVAPGTAAVINDVIVTKGAASFT